MVRGGRHSLLVTCDLLFAINTSFFSKSYSWEIVIESILSTRFNVNLHGDRLGDTRPHGTVKHNCMITRKQKNFIGLGRRIRVPLNCLTIYR